MANHYSTQTGGNHHLSSSHVYSMGSDASLMPFAVPAVRDVDTFGNVIDPQMNAVVQQTQLDDQSQPLAMRSLPSLSEGKVQRFVKDWVRLMTGYAGEGVARILPLKIAKEMKFEIVQPIVDNLILDEVSEGAPYPQSTLRYRKRSVQMRRFQGAQEAFYEALMRKDGSKEYAERVNACVRAFGQTMDKIFLEKIMTQQSVAVAYNRAFSSDRSAALDFIDMMCQTFMCGVKPGMSNKLLRTNYYEITSKLLRTN